LISVLLPHLNRLRSVAVMIKNDAILAHNRGNSAQFLRAGQLHGDFLISDLVGVGIRNIALNQIELTLVQTPKLLSDSDLQGLAHNLARQSSAADLIGFQNERMLFYDSVQRMYTDDGHGNGRLTPAGIEFLGSLGTALYSQTFPPQSAISRIVGPMAMLVTSRREDLLQTYDSLFNLAESNLQRPMRDADWAGYHQRLDQMHASLLESIRYALVLVIAPLERTPRTAECYLGHRDGVLVGLALEAYRRQHGEYPKSLDELTPLLLPAVPADRITGEPVRYRTVDGQPLVYSVGVDRKDDGGRPARVGSRHALNAAAQWNLAKNQPIPDGDWILYPQSKFEDDTD
jgi:hypothetical protein